MRKIVEFTSYDELKKYINRKIIKQIGQGSEGECFLGKDKFVYKLFYEEEISINECSLDISKIITTDEMDLDSFAFPIELYLIDGELKGYKTKYINRDLISLDKIVDPDAFFDIDLDKFILAYYRMLKDIITLSNNYISIFDLSYNLMFDGKNLYGIDTCYYYKTDKYPLEDNIKAFERAIEVVFNDWLNSTIDNNRKVRIIDGNIEEYFDEVQNLFESFEKGEEALLRKLFGNH